MMRIYFKPAGLFMCSFILLFGSKVFANQHEIVEKKKADRKVNLQVYAKGQRLYRNNCAICHGKQGEGAPNWRNQDVNGKWPAPPLNGTGHTWHHSTEVLTRIIKEGTGKLGGNMPAWKDRLNDQEIEAILTWVKAQWPDEIYSAWYNNFHSQ